jgi:hypothetical protein
VFDVLDADALNTNKQTPAPPLTSNELLARCHDPLYLLLLHYYDFFFLYLSVPLNLLLLLCHVFFWGGLSVGARGRYRKEMTSRCKSRQGSHHSEASKKKISESLKRKVRTRLDNFFFAHG